MSIAHNILFLNSLFCRYVIQGFVVFGFSILTNLDKKHNIAPTFSQIFISQNSSFACTVSDIPVLNSNIADEQAGKTESDKLLLYKSWVKLVL